MIYLKLIYESFVFAINAIIANKLRTILSLLGITIGIFCVISILTLVDSIKIKVRDSIESLGENTLFIEKWPHFSGGEYEWWKYMNRPPVNCKDLYELRKRSSSIDVSAFMVAFSKTVEYGNNNIENATILAISDDYDKTMSLNIKEGRFFSPIEIAMGKNVVILGGKISELLFENKDCLYKYIKVLGRKLMVIGVLEKQGEDNFGQGTDDQILMPVNYAKNIVDVDYEGFHSMIIAKPQRTVSKEEFKDDLTGAMRSIRKLKPGAEDNFAINDINIAEIENVFGIITLAGWIIAGFSLLVGGFGIANIMFVSVQERTNIIGIQKSLGAKNYFILLQFLMESVILCLIGGMVGLGIVYTGTLIFYKLVKFSLILTFSNIFMGLIVSVLIGLISGLAPAYRASRLNPVEAIRTLK